MTPAKLRHLLQLVACTVLVHCGANDDTAGVSPDNQPAEASAPSMGKADGGDSADRQCGIVLREARLEWCSRGYCDMTVVVDMRQDLLDSGATPNLLYTIDSLDNAGGTWWTSQFTEQSSGTEGLIPLGDAPSGYQRFVIRSGISDETLKMIPYYQTSDGRRVFDHNRLAGDFDNYVVTSQQPVTLDTNTCESVEW